MRIFNENPAIPLSEILKGYIILNKKNFLKERKWKFHRLKNFSLCKKKAPGGFESM